MFEKLTAAKPDPILGLADLYQADERSHKINLSIGIYKDENCTTPILNSVKKAEQFLLENELNKVYLPIDGLKSFNSVVQTLILGQNSELIESGRVKTLQAPGGTGALKVMADFFAKKTDVKKVWVSNPTWPNHHAVFSNAGIEVGEYRYYNPETHDLNEEAFFADLNNIPAGDVVLFHGCCHNPSGIDPTLEQWQMISNIALAKGWFPAFDFAYQGFGQGLDEDALGIRLFANAHPEFMIASSYSKNFGLYNERVGALTLIANDKEAANCALSQLKTVVRANYSNPPLHGASVVSHILNTPDLRDEWLDELTLMRERIHRMRLLFVKTLQEKGTGHDFSFIGKQNGMFSFSGLTEAQVLALREQYGIYFVNSGRINIAGMTLDNMSRLCESIISVISE